MRQSVSCWLCKRHDKVHLLNYGDAAADRRHGDTEDVAAAAAAAGVGGRPARQPGQRAQAVRKELEGRW